MARPKIETDPKKALARKREKERAKFKKKVSTSAGRNKERERAREGMAKLLAQGREIDIPDVVDKKRKKKCERSLRNFLYTYFPVLTYLKPADYHEEIISDFENAILYGRSEARAAPRGGGKDTLFTVVILWALLYGHRSWLVYANATLKLGCAKLENIKYELETNDLLFADFPEVCAPIRALERAPQRARMQTTAYGIPATYNEETGEEEQEVYFTRIKWGQDEIILPTIVGSPASGGTVSVVGLEGAVRGLVRGHLRPDFVAINDGETDEAARSEVQRKKIEETIEQSLAGLAGPGKVIPMFFLCTIVCPGCISETYTDPMLKPKWNGKRYAGVVKFPDREDLWQTYMDLWEDGKMSGEDPDARKAHKFYIDNRKAMDAGAVVSWQDRYDRDKLKNGDQKEVSALQHMYNLRVANGEKAFWSEIQNQPLPENSDALGLTPQLVASRVGGYTQGIVPDGAAKLTRGVDVRAREIHFVTKAHMASGDNYVVDYAVIPVDAPSGDLRDPTGEVKKSLEAAVLAGLRLMKAERDEYPYLDTQGNPVPINLTLVDSGFLPKIVYAFCRQSGPEYRPTKGFGNKQGQKRFAMPADKSKKKRPMIEAYASKLAGGQIVFHVNADHWKLFSQNRFAQSPETNGACSLPGMDPRRHRQYAKHICAEIWDPAEAKWEVKGPNHFLDCTALADCAAMMVGVRIREHVEAPQADDSITDDKPENRVEIRDDGGKRIKAPSRRRGGARRVKRRELVGW